ncbi:MAG: FAD-binding protein, partial [Planctomycetota bacterium]|nr:FAD-binding protein [Planctomycetota bacterium]
LQDLEFVQFHPTTLYLAGTERTLVTEAVRGEGGYLVDDRGERFLLDVHPAAELAPRDVVSQAIVHHLARPNVQGVFLDLRHWTAGHAERRFPGLFQSCARYGLDPARDPIPVRPAAHYFIGGIRCDIDGRTNLEGLYACGEASCTGLHGANRLASNSLLEGLVLGARAGIAAAATRSPRFDGDVGHAAARRTRRGDAADWLDLKESLESIMWRHVSIVRDADGLQQAAEKIAQWRHFTAGVRLDRRIPFETLNLLQLAGMVVAAAARREESRGTHLRSDRPERDDARYLGHFRWQRGAEPRFERLSERHG